MTSDEARAFIANAEWVWAETYAAFAPHEYTTRRSARERGISPQFTAFALLIEQTGWWRTWGQHRWRSLNLDAHTYWLYRVYEPANRRTVINRWWRDQMAPEPAQLSMEVD